MSNRHYMRALRVRRRKRTARRDMGHCRVVDRLVRRVR
jgi:hypothetical protein